MDKNITVLLGVLAVILIFSIGAGLAGVGIYNSLVGKDVDVENKWAKVQSAYQRRADLIPNLVETVKGARDFEEETQTKIAELRSQAGSAQQQVSNAKTVEDLQNANTEMSSVISRLLVVVEAYPDLKANQNFLSLQDELAGTENRIKFERDNYNDAVQAYKTSIRTFPGSIVAGMTGFSADKWSMFSADQGSEKTPVVDFKD
jgi:LemA protein